MFLQLCRNAPFLAVDTEGVEVLLGISVAIDENCGYYFPIGHQYEDNVTPDILDDLRELLETHKCLVFHHAKHDLKVLRRNNFILQGDYHCTMLKFHMIHENHFSKGLDNVAKYYGIPGKERPPALQTYVDNFGWDRTPAFLVKSYAEQDAKATAGIFKYIKPEWESEYKPELWAVEQDFIEVMTSIENSGIKIDRELCMEKSLVGRDIMEEIKNDLGWNPGSTKDLEFFLIGEMNFPIHKLTPGGKPSFDKTAMEYYDDLLEIAQSPVAKKVLRYRGWQKTVTSNYEPYLELADKDDILHPNFKLHGTKTGRLSCERPNLQQIPRHTEKEWNGDLKKAFIPREGKYLLDVDYSQLELRLAAAYAKEEALIEIFNAGRDVFTEMADQLGWPRYNTKTFTYATLYGGGVTRIHNLFGVSMEEARGMREQFFGTYPQLRKISNAAASLCKQEGYLSYWTGRRRHFDYPKDEAHKAFNSLIQGGAFEIVKRAMIRLHRNVPEARMVLQVHDSVVFEIDEGVDLTEKIVHEMTELPEDFGVPFVVEAKIWGA